MHAPNLRVQHSDCEVYTCNLNFWSLYLLSLIEPLKSSTFFLSTMKSSTYSFLLCLWRAIQRPSPTGNRLTWENDMNEWKKKFQKISVVATTEINMGIQDPNLYRYVKLSNNVVDYLSKTGPTTKPQIRKSLLKSKWFTVSSRMDILRFKLQTQNSPAHPISKSRHKFYENSLPVGRAAWQECQWCPHLLDHL